MVIMSRDTLSIGSTPYGEDCAQVGATEYDYATRARAECKAFMQQIVKHYPEPDNGYLKIKANPHDFGTYYEVNAVYDMDDNEAYVWALSVERDEKGVLEFWEPEFNPHKQ